MSAAASAQAVEGELTFDTVPALYRASAAWFAGTDEVVIDLARVTRVDSAGLALLIDWLQRAERAGRPLRFANIPETVQTLLRISGLDNQLPA